MIGQMIKLTAAADNVLRKLDNMSDEELLQALESCEDNSIGYAVCDDRNGF